MAPLFDENESARGIYFRRTSPEPLVASKLSQKILDADIIIKTDQARHPLLMSAQNLILEFHGDGKPVHPDFTIRASKHDDDSWKMVIDGFNISWDPLPGIVNVYVLGDSEHGDGVSPLGFIHLDMQYFYGQTLQEIYDFTQDLIPTDSDNNLHLRISGICAVIVEEPSPNDPVLTQVLGIDLSNPFAYSTPEVMQSLTRSREAGIPDPVQFWDMTNPSGTPSVQAWNEMDSNTLYGIATHKFDKHATPQDRFSLMIAIASTLRLRHVRYGDVIAIDKSIELGRTALLLTDSLDGNSKSHALADLGYSIYWRADFYHNPKDLAESIDLLESAFRTKDSQDKDAACIVYLATALIKSFQISHDTADIDRAIHCLRITLEADEAKNDSNFSHKNLLAVSLSLRFDISENEKDLQDAISLLREAADLPDTDRLKSTSLSNLGLLLKKLHSHSLDKDKAEIVDEIITMMRRAVELTPDGFPDKVDTMFNLAQSLRQRGHPGDIQEALAQSSTAARSRFGSIWSLFDAAEEWRRDALECGVSPLEAFRHSLELLPRMAWHGLPISQRHLRLVQWSHLTCDAAAVAVEEEQYNLAVEWLEQGRSIVWGQLIQLRSPLETLQLKKPDQAERLAQLSRYLEGISTGNIQTLGMDDISNEDLSHRQHFCADEFDKLLEKVREDPEFEDFLRPPKFSKLVGVNKHGPVVLLNASGDRCDALALLPGMDDEVMYIPLENFSRERALALHGMLRDCLSTSSIRTQHDRIGRTVRPSGRDDPFIALLAELWTCVIEPVLGCLSLLNDAEGSSRIWWCPAGPLSFLPLHAAGIYGTSESDPKASDFVISSYIPTLSVLLNKQMVTKSEDFNLLAVSQPSIGGCCPIPNTKEEIDKLEKCAAGLTVLRREGPEVTTKQLQVDMGKCSWAHFACHGVQDLEDPMMSGLDLDNNERLQLSDIIAKDLHHTEFAFLSACQTASGDGNLPDEAIHLAAGMLLAGYRGVIATMWSIKDNDAPLIAEEVYSRLLKGGRPNATLAASALQDAVKVLRNTIGDTSFLSWVPFIHIGI